MYVHLDLNIWQMLQSDLHCIQDIGFIKLTHSVAIELMTLALLLPCSTVWATVM